MTAPTLCQTTYTELARLIAGLGTHIGYSGKQPDSDVDALEGIFDLQLPKDYRTFLSDYGALVASGGITILGLGSIGEASFPVGDAILALRMVADDVTMELIPIEDLGQGYFACLLCSHLGPYTAPVLLFNAGTPQPVSALTVLAPCFSDYLHNRLVPLQPETADTESSDARAGYTPPSPKALATLRKHVKAYQKEFGYSHSEGGKLPRNHDWRPFRYCIQDVLFSAAVVRHNREWNCLEVDVFLTADIPEYEPLDGVRALATFLLSEAYKCGGTMEIRFTRNVEGGHVPNDLLRLAAGYSISISEAEEGRISSGEAKALYAALTEFSSALREQIERLEDAGRVKMVRACYVVHHGVWSREQVEMIVLGSIYPDSLLGGLSRPDQRHLYVHDVRHGRAAILGGLLDRRLLLRERTDSSGTSYDLEDDIRPVSIEFEGATYTKIYSSEEPFEIPWLYNTHSPTEFNPGVPHRMVLRARDASDLLLHLRGDLELAAKMKRQEDIPVLLVVPDDFNGLPSSFIEEFTQQLSQARVSLMVCPENVSSMDTDAAARLATSRILRQ